MLGLEPKAAHVEKMSLGTAKRLIIMAFGYRGKVAWANITVLRRETSHRQPT